MAENNPEESIQKNGPYKIRTVQSVRDNREIPSENLSIKSSSPDEKIDSDFEMRVNSLVAEAVVHGLSHFGGENVLESLLYILELEHSIDLHSIVNKLDPFRAALSNMFGTASYVVEERVCGSLAKSMGLDPEGRTLEGLIEEARGFVKRASVSGVA